MKYLLHKQDHRVLPANPELLDMAARNDSDYLVIDEADALPILRDRSGAKVREFFQRRRLEEAQRLLAIAQGDVAAAETAAPAAPRPSAAEQAAASAQAWSEGKSAKLTDAEVSVSLRDAGPTAQASSATPEQIAKLPKIEPTHEPDTAPPPAPAPASVAPVAPAAPAPAPADSAPADPPPAPPAPPAMPPAPAPAPAAAAWQHPGKKAAAK